MSEHADQKRANAWNWGGVDMRPSSRSRLVDLNELDALAGEWRSVHNLLMEAAVHARQAALDQPKHASWHGQYAAACEAVATRLSNP